MDKKIKKYISSSVKFHDFKGAVELASELGTGIEISRFGKLREIEENYNKLLKEYKAILKDFDGDVSLHGFFSNLTIASKDPLIREASKKRYAQSFELACEFGAKTVVFHTCFNNVLKHKEYRENFFLSNIEFYREFIKQFEREKITATIENVHEPNNEFIRNLIGAINSPYLKTTLDVGHVNLHSEIPPALWVKDYGLMLHHLHLHNNFGDEDSHSSLLKGSANIQEVLKAIYDIQINPSYTFEIFDKEELIESLKYFDEIISEFNQDRKQ